MSAILVLAMLSFSFDSVFKPLPQPEIGVCTSYTNADVLAKAGYSFIEENVQSFLVPTKSEEEFEKILEDAKNAALPIKSFIIFLPGNLKSVGPDAVHAEILDYAEIVFRRARKAGVGIVVFGSSGSRSVPEGFSKEEARKQFIQLGIALGPIAARHDVVLVLEPLNKKECNFINSVLEAGEIVEEVNHPNFQLLVDIYHMKMEGEGPESILLYGRFVKHAHVAEKEGRAVPGTHGEDIHPYYQALQHVGYQGKLSIEGNWVDMEAQASVGIKTIKNQW
ncbi:MULTISPECIES: sugar phosphate isomerase/epimerase family protein [Rhodonellum]|nr:MULTISPECIES: sugar phosphate isomerase/epimerase family protein [Rhodonellum]SDZ48748.1 Sugar phosphate isomerase/epimerase [Rhodonellum ikkaensis]